MFLPEWCFDVDTQIITLRRGSSCRSALALNPRNRAKCIYIRCPEQDNKCSVLFLLCFFCFAIEQATATTKDSLISFVAITPLTTKWSCYRSGIANLFSYFRHLASNSAFRPLKAISFFFSLWFSLGKLAKVQVVGNRAADASSMLP